MADTLGEYVTSETTWLTSNQLGELFDRDKSVVARHLLSIYKSKELSQEATAAKNATVQFEGERQVERTLAYYTPMRERGEGWSRVK